LTTISLSIELRLRKNWPFGLTNAANSRFLLLFLATWTLQSAKSTFQSAKSTLQPPFKPIRVVSSNRPQAQNAFGSISQIAAAPLGPSFRGSRQLSTTELSTFGVNQQTNQRPLQNDDESKQ
jgi:hypothetical protein